MQSTIIPSLMLEDAAYIAGFFDGEGHCSLSFHRANYELRGHIRYALSVGITNTNRDILAWMQRELRLGMISARSKEKAIHKVAYELSFPRHHTQKFLMAILPYLRMKKKQAELMLEYLALDNDENPRSGEISDAMLALNKKGT